MYQIVMLNLLGKVLWFLSIKNSLVDTYIPTYTYIVSVYVLIIYIFFFKIDSLFDYNAVLSFELLEITLNGFISPAYIDISKRSLNL